MHCSCSFFQVVSVSTVKSARFGPSIIFKCSAHIAMRFPKARFSSSPCAGSNRGPFSHLARIWEILPMRVSWRKSNINLEHPGNAHSFPDAASTCLNMPRQFVNYAPGTLLLQWVATGDHLHRFLSRADLRHTCPSQGVTSRPADCGHLLASDEEHGCRSSSRSHLDAPTAHGLCEYRSRLRASGSQTNVLTSDGLPAWHSPR